MAWKIYIEITPGIWTPVTGTFKTEQDAKLFYRRNQAVFRRPDGSYGKPMYVNQGKGSK